MEQLESILAEINNETIFNALIKARAVLLHHQKINVYISGGSDSDVVLDMIERCKNEDNEIHYVWFNTGVEYQATKDHLVYLEKRYNISIERVRAEKTIPTCCRQYGQPFLSKFVSGKIYSLQRNGFKWEDEPLDILLKRYPKCKSAIKWWCNAHEVITGYKVSRFNINYNRYLKDFILENPPTFKISSNCCLHAKKNVAKKYDSNNSADLAVTGIRRAEGGIRATTYKSCYTHDATRTPSFRPIFWFKDEDKNYYDSFFAIKHSDCYTVYKLKRTGCVGCPFAKNFEGEIKCIETNEPLLAKACNTIFKDSYEYTKRFKEFRETKKKEEKGPR